jgi:hypothetical protein
VELTSFFICFRRCESTVFFSCILYSIEDTDCAPKLIGQMVIAEVLSRPSFCNQTPFVSSGFDAGNLPLFGFGKRLAV